MGQKKDFNAVCRQICAKCDEERLSNQLFLNDRLEAIREMASNLGSDTELKERIMQLLILCATLTDSCRARKDVELSRSNSGAERIPQRILDIFDDQFGWRELDMIGRGLSAMNIPGAKVFSWTQAMLLLSDLFFVFRGPAAYKKGLKLHPFRSKELEHIDNQAITLLHILKKHFSEKYFEELLDRFEDSVISLKNRKPTEWENLMKSLEHLRTDVETFA